LRGAFRLNDARGGRICLAGNFTTKTPSHKEFQLRNFLGVLASWWLNFFVPPPKKISARQKVIAQWRGVDLAPIEAAKAVRARDAGNVVSKVLVDLKMDSRRADIEIVKVWNSLIDPNLTAHAQPHNLHKGTLFVNVDSSAWLSEIVRYRRKEILDRLQHSFGKNLIQKISFRIG
jgi:hypothetical protein